MGGGTAGQLVRVKLGARKTGKRGGGVAEGEFLRELHSLGTSGYIGSCCRRDETGTDKGGSENKESQLGPETLRRSGK